MCLLKGRLKKLSKYTFSRWLQTSFPLYFHFFQPTLKLREAGFLRGRMKFVWIFFLFLLVTWKPEDGSRNCELLREMQDWCHRTPATCSSVIFSLLCVLKSFLKLGVSKMREEQKHVYFLGLAFFVSWSLGNAGKNPCSNYRKKLTCLKQILPSLINLQTSLILPRNKGEGSTYWMTRNCTFKYVLHVSYYVRNIWEQDWNFLWIYPIKSNPGNHLSRDIFYGTTLQTWMNCPSSASSAVLSC